MYITAQRIRWEDLRSIAFGDISGTYEAVGDSLANPARIIKFLNQTDVDILVSTNGVDDKDLVPAGGFSLYDMTANRPETNSGSFVDQGTTFYVKGTPTSGTFYVVVIYASSN
jgi:hypothetical protein